MYKKCEHENFKANVIVNRLKDSGGFICDIRINCAECDLPFEFPGLPAGLSFSEARVSPDAQELRLPIKPKGTLVFPAVPGFDVRVQ